MGADGQSHGPAVVSSKCVKLQLHSDTHSKSSYYPETQIRKIATYIAQCSLQGGKPYWGATASDVARCLYGSAGRNGNEYTPPEAYLDQTHRTSLGNRNDHLKINQVPSFQPGLVP